MARGGGNKKKYQYCRYSSGVILYFRALQGHSGRSLIDPFLQDSVIIPDGFFKYNCHVECAINLHSIINSGLIPVGQNLANDRQYSFCLWIPWTQTIRILTRSTWEHRVLRNTCIKHGRNIKTRCIGSIPNLLKRKGWSSIRRDRTLSFFTIHSQLIVSRKLFGWKLKKSYTRKYMRHLVLLQRFPWNMTGWKNWVQKLLDKQKSTNQPTQPNPNPNHDERDPLWQNERPVQVLRKSIHVSLVTARIPICLLNVQGKTKTQTKT